MKYGSRPDSGMISVFVLLFTLVFFIPVSQAHRVIIFAWTEGDTVHTASKFPGGGKVTGSPVVVYDAGGARLLEGKTNEQGEYSFKIPKVSPLKIVLQAGAGHQGEWVLSEDEVKAALGKAVAPEASPVPASPPSPEEKREPESPDTLKKEIAHAPGLSGTDHREIESIVDRALDRKLKPVIDLLADMHDPGPSISDIFGGIGYILGLFGIAAYVASRK